MIMYDTVNYIARWNGTEMDTCLYSPVHVEVKEIIDADTKLSIYPVPGTSMVTIESTNELIITRIILLASKGENVLEQSVNSDFYTLNITELDKGNYFIKVSLENGETYMKKLIKE